MRDALLPSFEGIQLTFIDLVKSPGVKLNPALLLANKLMQLLKMCFPALPTYLDSANLATWIHAMVTSRLVYLKCTLHGPALEDHPDTSSSSTMTCTHAFFVVALILWNGLSEKVRGPPYSTPVI